MPPLDPTPQPIDTLLQRGDGDAVALIDREGRVTFDELELLVGQVAYWLQARGLKRGDRVASWLPKSRLACILPLAAPRAGMVHVPINPVLKRGQVAHILQDSGAALIISQKSRLAALLPEDVPSACQIAEDGDVVAADGLPPSDAAADLLAAILYTSGSTGKPKGVMLSHANLWLGAISVANYLKIDSKDVVLAVLPLSFDYGQNQLLSTWAAGGAVVPLDYLTPRDVVKAVVRYGVTSLAGVPPLWTQLLEVEWPEEAVHSLARLTNSGGALTRTLVAGLRARFPTAALFPMYGLTEAFRSTYLDPALVDVHPDSIGTAIPLAEVLVVGSDGKAAEQGELVHAGPLVALGYWRDAERTAQRFRPAPDFSHYGGTAVWSGDTVMLDANGLLYFVGRDDEMIKSSGNRISPNEIEEAALAGGEALEAVAIGVPDPRLGHAIHLVLRGDPSREEELRARLRRDLPSFMQPAIYDWRDAMPKNANGKLDRSALKAEVTR